MRGLFIVGVSLVLHACVSTVSSIEVDQDIDLQGDKGFLLIGVESNRNLKSIRISGPQQIALSSKDIRKGTNYILVDLKAGRYTITKVELDRIFRFELDDKENWQFNVRPEQLSYVGHFEVKSRGPWGLSANMELVNRSSEALEFLEQKFPSLIQTRPVIYEGPGEDNFFEYIQNTGSVAYENQN